MFQLPVRSLSKTQQEIIVSQLKALFEMIRLNTADKF
jgi:hypothetical protein